MVVHRSGSVRRCIGCSPVPAQRWIASLLRHGDLALGIRPDGCGPGGGGLVGLDAAAAPWPVARRRRPELQPGCPCAGRGDALARLPPARPMGRDGYGSAQTVADPVAGLRGTAGACCGPLGRARRAGFSTGPIRATRPVPSRRAFQRLSIAGNWLVAHRALV